MSNASRIAERAAQLRRDFDRAFAEPIRFDETLKEDFLAIRAGGRPFAIRLSEISGLFADKTITPVPGGHPALRGIAGFRGTMLPAYDLQILLGLPGAQSPRWLMIAKAQPVALAFEAFDGQLRVASDAVLGQPARSGSGAHAHDVLRAPEFSGPIIHLLSALNAITALKAETAPQEE
jgi:purine-binding chemotaxis protein CheW